MRKLLESFADLNLSGRPTFHKRDKRRKESANFFCQSFHSLEHKRTRPRMLRIEMEAKKIDGTKARTVLWYLTFFCFAINFMLRVNVNISIVDMISDEFKATKISVSDCLDTKNGTFDDLWKHNASSSVTEKCVSIEKRFLSLIGVSQRAL